MKALIKRPALWATHGAEAAGILRLLEFLDREQGDQLRVLTYHRVANPADTPDLYPGLVSATPEGFDAQLCALERRYHVISMGELLAARRRSLPLPPRSLLLTFDDAYDDFADLAWPILQRHSLPATLFVPTGFPDRPDRAFWWDRLHQAVTATAQAPIETELGRLSVASAGERWSSFVRLRDRVKQLPHDEAMALVEEVCDRVGGCAGRPSALGWDPLRTLARAGVTLAPHSRSHPLMSRIPAQQMREEAGGSLADLLREVGPTLPVFAYPSGSFDDRVVDALELEGYELAFTTQRGVNDLRTEHPLRLRRIHVGLKTTAAVLRTQLLSTVGAIQRFLSPSIGTQEAS